MYAVTIELDFCYGHRLLDYVGKCMHPHGHNGRVQIELQVAALDHRGMVHDFGDVKAAMKGWVDKELDHMMILRRDDPILPVLQGMGEPCFVMDANPTAEALARLLFDHAAAQGFPVTAVRFWETPTSFATYAKPPAGGQAASRETQEA
jgi:6-pyruvoyltetrahydropterin/6-carboxytetrahydropterin synthase